MKTRPSFPRRLSPVAAFALAAFSGVSIASAQTPVFTEDFTTLAPGTTVNGLMPAVGGPISVTQGQNAGINNPNPVGTGFATQNASGFDYVTTDGAQRVINLPFTSTLGAAQTLTITVNFEAPGGNFFGGGFAGFRVETAASETATQMTNGGSGGVAFFGDTNDDTSGFDLATGSAGGTGEIKTGDTAGFVAGTGNSTSTGIATATFTYVYNTGVATLSISGPNGTVNSGPLSIGLDQAINGLQFENNNGDDGRFSLITASVVTATSSSATWTGAANNGLWDTTSINFKDGGSGTPRAYNDAVSAGTGDNVTFDDTATGTHTVNIAATVHPGSITVNTATSYTINAPAGSDGIDGGGNLTVQSGTLNLNGTNGYGGLTAVQSGTLNVSSGASLGVTPFITLGAGTTSGTLIDNTTASETVPASLVSNGGSADTVTIANAGGTLVLSGPLNGSAPLTKSGNGQLSITGLATGFTQAINLTAGTLSLAGATSGPINISSANAVLNYTASGSGPGSVQATTAATITASGAASVILSGASSFASTLNFNGPGHVTLGGATTFGGAINVNAGRLSLTNAGNTLTVGPVVSAGATLEYGPGALGTAGAASNAVTLNGGTLALSGGAGLLGNYYNITPNNNDGNNGDSNFTSIATLDGFLSTQTPAVSASTVTGGQANLDFSNSGYGNGAPFAGQGFNATTNYEVEFKGYIEIPTAGIYNFSTTSDDGSLLGIDGTTVEVNNFFQGATTATGAITLTAGLHQIEVGYYQGGGGQGLQVLYNGPGISNIVIPNSVLTQTSGFSDTTAVTLSGASTIDPEGTSATIGSINFTAGSGLEVKAGSLLSQTTNFTTAGGTGAFTINVDANGTLNPGLLTTTNTTDTATLHLTGAGSLVLLGASGPLLNAGTVIDLGGTGLNTLILADQSAIGSATINFSGGGLAVVTSNPGTAIDLTVPYTYSAGSNGSITAGAVGYGAAGGTLNLNSPSVPSGDILFLGSTNGYTLNLTGVPTGGGNIGITSGQVNIAAHGTGSAIDGLGLIFSPASGVTATANVNANSANLAGLSATSAGTANLIIGTGTGSPIINLNDGGANNTFNGNINATPGNSNPTLNKLGAGTLTLGGTNNLAAVNVTTGGLTLSSTGTVGSVNVNLANGTTLTLAGAGTLTSNPTLSGFAGNQTNGTLAATAINGAGNTIELTDGNGNEATSVFTKNQISTLAGFVAQYVYQALPGGSGAGNLADGTAFVIQSQGSTALGGGGGALGYAGITNSGGLEFNLYPGNPPGTIAVASTGGAATGGYIADAPVSLPSGDPILVNVKYDGATTLVETLTDETTNATYTNTFTNFNLNGALIGDQGYIGFTGADGGASSIQTITNFVFSNATVANYTNSLSVSNGATVSLQLNASSTVTGLTVGANGILNVTPTANSVPNIPYNFGVVGTTTLSGNATFNIAMNGSGLGSVTLNAVSGSAGSSLTTNGPGTLILAGAATYTGPTNVNGGTLAVGASGSISGNKINVASAAIFDTTAQTSGYTVPLGQTVNLAIGSTVNGNLDVSGALVGQGRVNGNVTVNSGGSFTPGSQGGLLSLTGNLTTNANGALNIEFGGAGNNDTAVVAATSTISLNGPLTGSLFDGYKPAAGDLFFIVVGSSLPVMGFFSNQSAGVDANGFNTITVAGEVFEVSYTASEINSTFSGGVDDVALLATGIPEPSSLLSLLGAGTLLTGLGRFRRRS